MSARIYQLPPSMMENAFSPNKERVINDENIETQAKDMSSKEIAIPIHSVTKENEKVTAKRRWKIVKRHVCITQWLSKYLMQPQVRKFSLAQETLIDAGVMKNRNELMDILIKIREQFLSLLDAEHCFVSFDAQRSILEFDGQSIYPSTRMKGVTTSTASGSATSNFFLEMLASHHTQVIHLPHLNGDTSNFPFYLDHTNIDIRSYLCIPLVDGNHVEAVVEILNSRLDPNVLDVWLGSSLKNDPLVGSLNIFRSFVGKLIKVILKRSNSNEIFHTSTTNESSSTTTTTTTTTTTISSSSSMDMNISSSADSENEDQSNEATIENSIEKAVDFLRQTVEPDHIALFEYDKDSNVLWTRWSDLEIPSTINFGQGIIGTVASSGNPFHASQNTEPPLTQEFLNQLPEGTCDVTSTITPIKSILAVPTIDDHHKRNGVVLLLLKQKKTKKTKEDFDPADISISERMGIHLGHALYSTHLHEAIGKAQGKAQTLLDLSAVLFRELETNSLLMNIMEAIKKPMNASKCGMFLMDEEKEELYSPFGYSEIAQDLNLTEENQECRLSIKTGILGACARSGQVINVHDAYHDPRFNASYDLKTGFRTRSVLAVPIKDATGKVLGVVEMINKLSKLYFDKDDEELAKGIAYYLAIALTNARLFDHAKLAMRRSDALLAMMQVISSNENTASDVFQSIMDKTSQILNVQHAALFFVDPLSGTLFSKISTNWKGYILPMGLFFQGKCAQKGQVICINGQISQHEDYDPKYDILCHLNSKNILCVPVKVKKNAHEIHLSTNPTGTTGTSTIGSKEKDEWKVIAVFYVVNKIASNPSSNTIQHVAFHEEDIKILSALCGEISSVIERRSWELGFQQDEEFFLPVDESNGEEEHGGQNGGNSGAIGGSGLLNHDSAITSSFLSQYTSNLPVSRRRSSTHSLSSSSSSSSSHPTTSTEEISSFHLNVSSLKNIKAKSSRNITRQMLICTWDLNPWNFSTVQLIDFILEIFDFYDLPRFFDCPLGTLKRFIVSIKGQYQNLPYHNFLHAFTTLHISFLVVHAQSPNRHLFDQKDLMAIFLAAYCHDVNHNGRNNDFHIRYRTSIAMVYNDQSVLENMHASTCFETMRRPGNNIFEKIMDQKEYRYLRKCIIRAILATDMQNHASIVTCLHEKLKKDIFNPEEEAHKELLINAIVHSADISNPTLSKEIHFQWSLYILQEFNMQYEEEIALGMTPTLYMNAKPMTPEHGKLNLAFIDACVFPLWSIMNNFLDGLENCLLNIQNNRTIWIKQMEQVATNSSSTSTSATSQSHH
jgi:GAF domain-containing protein